MPSIRKTVDKTIVNGPEIFTYTIFIDFADLSESIQISKVVDIIPTKIKYTLPPVAGTLVSITETAVTEGTKLEFNLGQVNSGTSLSFDLGCSFGPGRVDNDTFINTASLYGDNKELGTASADEVKVILSENMKITKITDGGYYVSPGETKTVYLDIRNTGDPGKLITNIEVTDPLSQGVVADTTFTPVGYCIDENGYCDKTYDNRTGTWNNNTLNFTLPSFNGATYRIKFQVKIDDSVESGSSLENTGYLKVNGVDTDESFLIFNVRYTGPHITLSKDAPYNATIGGPIRYKLCANNTGSEKLTNVVFTDLLPPEVNIVKLQFNVDPSFVQSYDLYYESSSEPTVYKPIATNLSGTSQNYDLNLIITDSSRVLSVRAVLSSMEVDDYKAACFELFGYVDYSATYGQIIENHGEITGTGTTDTTQDQIVISTILDGKSTLSIQKIIPNLKDKYYTLDEFTIEMKTVSDFNQIVNPVFADLLPIGIDYVPGHDYIVYESYLGIEYSSGLLPDGINSASGNYYIVFSNHLEDEHNLMTQNLPIPLPVTEIIHNYMDTGRTLVRFKFLGFTLVSAEALTVSFGAVVKINPPGSFVNYAYLGNPGDNTNVNTNLLDCSSILDDYDLDGDGIFDENIARSAQVSAAILTTSEFSLQKWVRGDLDTDYCKNGCVTPGGDIFYKLYITNNQPIYLRDIEIVDIFPHKNDTGVILNYSLRGSRFNVYAVADVSAVIENVLGDPVDPFPYIKTEYSTSYNPVRFDYAGTGTIGTGTWSLNPPSNITTLAAIRITTGPNVILKSYERLVITIHAKAPVGVSPNLLAYNSFAVKANKVEGNSVVPMNPTEPPKVSVTVNSISTGSIGNFVWLDSNRNGLYDDGEIGINGIIVELYNELGTKLAQTVTSNNFTGNPGYYLFTNVSAGNYYVKFIPYGNYSLTIQRKDQSNGSMPNSYSGLTDMFTLTENENLTTINAGVILPPTITPIKTAPSTVPCNHIFDYTLTFTNSYESLASNVKISDNLPEGFIVTKITIVNNGLSLAPENDYTYTTTAENTLIINGVGHALDIKSKTSLVVTITGYYPCNKL